jgi:hypothetical protein
MPEQRVRVVDLYELNKYVTYGSRTTLRSAAMASPETVRLAQSCGLKVNRVQATAGLHADVQTLAALHELGIWLDFTLIDAAALSGRLHILQHLLIDKQCEPPDELDYFAARSGSISMLKWLKTQSWSSFCAYTCEGAAQGGQLAALQYLRSVGCKWYERSIAYHAARSGSIETIEWLRPHEGVEVDARAMKGAASEGQTAMCKHLCSTGCDWNVDSTSNAASGNYPDTLRWLRENGCPWDVSFVCMYAAYNGSTDILDFVIEQGEVLDAQLLSCALRDAVSHNQQEAVHWLKQCAA